ncbi:DNA-binding response regulator [Thermobispora bispora]|uniref:response regulator transcription factor n=1 Tax=Thermobispora bispora TaxID=2006 RepID=UPI0019822547|nr:response regulator transcription factor [Thermobispora bispora]MBO2472968.1 DNA-binding response regulator [Actinomycetales bacterium]MBX6166322.1 response regulator transcription factor [Thermobispora bispora]MDI9579871.1 response regulator transcription factor [Thermobispora sp.]QSI47549.1 response regulator transcription factor [Thermobispora bispora]
MIRILLADDEHLVRGAIAALLGLEGDLEVVAQVGRGDEVEEAVRRHDPDVIVLDVEMPGMDGLTVAERLTGRAILILTSFGRPGYLRRALAAGVRGFIPKDAPAEQLAEAIRKVHAGGRYLDPELAALAMTAGDCPLTQRERDALKLAAEGATVAEIAAAIHLSEGTVRNYLSNAITKLGAGNRITAIRVAREMGWI